MTSKEKVLKLEPSAHCKSVATKYGFNYYIMANNVKISTMQRNKSWAWADAYRGLTGKPLN